MPNANPLKFGVHSILTQRPREDVAMLQGELAIKANFSAQSARQNFTACFFHLRYC